MSVPQKVTSELQSVAPSAIIELFELRLVAALHGSNDVYRFHAGVNGKSDGGAVVWAGNSYSAYPVEADGFAYNGEGQIPRPQIRISNQLGLITAILQAVNSPTTGTPGNDLVGATVYRIRVLAKHIDAANFPGNVNPYGTPDPTAELPREIYSITRKSQENRDVVEFELAAVFDLAGITAPRRICIANLCNWVYRSAECGYTGDIYYNDSDNLVSSAAQDVCSKRLAGCEARFGPVAFTGSVTQGSATLTGVNATLLGRVAIGDFIYGSGIPQGTTVTSKATSSLVMSQAATATTTLSKTGTLNATGTAITVSSASGLLPGMTVAGTNVPTGTTITAITGNTVALSIAYNPNTRGSAETKTGSVVKYQGAYQTEELWQFTNVSGIQIGDLAGNTNGITTAEPHGASVYSGTKVASIASNSVVLSKVSRFENGASITAIFWRPVTFSSATYTFTASNKFTARADRNLPFGSFPGVGGFFK